MKNQIRDYRLTGEEAPINKAKGLTDAVWYQSPVDKNKMRNLLTRKDGPAIRDTLLWFALIISSGVLVFLLRGTWWVVFPYIIYSVLYASTSDSRWHESSHGTAFKTDWMNNVLYEISSFMVLRQSTVWRWSHSRHHSDTIIRGYDPEIAVPRPPKAWAFILGFFGVPAVIGEMKKLFQHIRGKIDPEVATFLPKSEYKKVFRVARIYFIILLAVIISSILLQTILPLMYIGLPTFLGAWLMPVYGYTQHAGLAENVLDHRLNCRTVHMNRVHRFLYWNMNYHVEHHMYPLVPYHALPHLHELIKDDCPPAYSGIIEAFKEIIPTVRKQINNPSYFVKRELPKGAGTIKDLVLSKKKKEHFIKDEMVMVCYLSELGKGEAYRFDFKLETYAIYRTSLDHYYATAGMCTHGNEHLAEGMVIDEMIECSKHNGRFDLNSGKAKRLPACIDIKTLKVHIKEEAIWLNISDLNTENNKALMHKVVATRFLTPTIKEIVLLPIQKSIDYSAGQYIQVDIPPYELSLNKLETEDWVAPFWNENNLTKQVAKNSINQKRNYSMVHTADTKGSITLNVRLAYVHNNKQLAGIGSSYLFSLKVGDALNLTGAFGDFKIKTEDTEKVYIGGGAGMAPIRSHIEELLIKKSTKKKISFWYGARNQLEIYYDDFFHNLTMNYKNFHFKLGLSDDKIDDTWSGSKGFIHEIVYNEYLKTHMNLEHIEFYLCGPPSMIEATKAMLKQLNIKENQITIDAF